MKPVINKSYYTNGNICCIEYLLNKKLHREDGPAIIYYDENGIIGSENYFINGECHREDGPAIIYYDNNGNINISEYYINGKRHREDGPAVIYHSSISQYFLNGIQLTESKFLIYQRKRKLKNIL